MNNTQRTNEEIMENFVEIMVRMSPENLSCDGELSPPEARARFKNLRREWVKLEQELGKELTEADVSQWEYEKIRKI